MGVALLIVLWAIALGSAYFFIAHDWWLPAAASAQAATVDRDLFLTFAIFGVLFLAAQLALGLFVWRYRVRPASPPHAHSDGNTTLELAWTLVAALVFLGMSFYGYSSWAERRLQPASANALQVEVTGAQFQWYFRYPGPDGKFGRTRTELQDPATGNPLGLDDTDPEAQDDVVSAVLMLPEQREVAVLLRSHDVIHSFFIPEMRVKQDAVPGLMISTHFTPTVSGDYELACAELCGLGHYRMRAPVRVLPAAEFDGWLSSRRAEQAAAR